MTKFNGVFFGDFKTGNDFGSDGSLAIGGSFTSGHAVINRLSTVCSEIGLVLQGDLNAKQVTVNGVSTNPTVESKHCAAAAPRDIDFSKMYSQSMQLSEHLAGLFPNYTMDRFGAVVKVLAEGLVNHQRQVFTMNAYCTEDCPTKSYFQCSQDRICQVPSRALSEIHGMMLGEGLWKGPLEQQYSMDDLVIFNVKKKKIQLPVYRMNTYIYV